MRVLMTARTRSVVTAVLWVSLATLPASVDAQTVEGRFDRTLDVSGQVELDVTSGSGSITVRPGRDGAVHVVGLIRARDSRTWARGLSAEEKVKRLESQPPVELVGQTARVGHIDDEDLRDNVSISYEIEVPSSTRVRSRTGSGSQNIGNLNGPANVSSGSGGLRIGNIGGDVDSSTGSGEIDITGVRGQLVARTGSGSIRAGSVSGAVRASTGSGRIEIALAGEGDVEVSAGSGSLSVRGIRGALRGDTGSGSIRVEGQPSREWRLTTGSGGIDVALPGEASFSLDAHASSGSINTRHPVTMVGTISRRQIRGDVRGGGPLLYLRSSSGSISVQ